MSLIKYLLDKKYGVEFSNEISKMCNGEHDRIESIYDRFRGETLKYGMNHNEQINKGN